MRIVLTAMSLAVLGILAMRADPASAAPLSPHGIASPTVRLVQAAGHRAHHRGHRHHAKHGDRHRKYGHRHHRRHKGWLPPLKDHRHLPGQWSHDHCKDWHRCHYYFYGYKQWAKWNPDKSRAYFRHRYHH